ncbi:hypothetical protein ASG19_04555 [Rhizobium sp. Leaf306]|uniref:hypothetical protein n=1 Tax=Rhizobium sp. Leaf306 TaxID=1736330 RepID=UPI0007127859|nr:hypothetical protein [Rhizobium sp. Leaf306]KQQ38329.1 hypothetical protein ASG19_04555 [Rhizobium sp. Leaf306]
MLEEEAKQIAKKNPIQRLRVLAVSASGVMTLVLGLLGVLVSTTSVYIAGYNQSSRVVFFQESAQEYQKTLREAKQDIGLAINEIGFENIPKESQRRLALAFAKIDLVDKALEPQEDGEKGIFFPKWGSLLVTPAYAQDETSRAIAKEDFRQTLAMGLLVAITLFWLFCLGMYFFSKDEKKISFSANMIQTVLGFYIGVFTGLMGLTPPA